MRRVLRATVLVAPLVVVGCQGGMRAPTEEGGVAFCGPAALSSFDRRVDAATLGMYPANSSWRQIVAATALIVDVERLVPVGEKVELQGIPVGLCSDERFAQQDALGPNVCSGFLVAPDRIVTAGHCAPDESERNQRRIVFGLVATDDGRLPSTIEEDRVYRIASIAERRDDETADLAVLLLDRPVPTASARPLPIAPTQPFPDQPVSMVGYPAGLPAKIDACLDAEQPDCHPARVASVSATWFWSGLQAYGGNSGSPILNAELDVIGVLSSGETQYCVDPDMFCLRARPSPAGAPTEKATRVDGRRWVP